MSKPCRIAFAGFRHPHIMALLARVRAHPDCEVVASCEGDQATREKLNAGNEVKVTHSDFERMIEECDVNIIAIGDIYARRGKLAVAALRAGKHIISDKPLCTSSDELEQIAELAGEQNLSVGCQLDLVEAGSVRQLKAAIQRGELGRLCTITISAQHPLRLGSRADWYFETGQHGGTINDIGIHIFDLVPWLSGQPWERILLAREWNAKAASFPYFKDCAQFYAVAVGGLSCFADVSYLAPDIVGYDLPQYWRITAHGTRGMAEISYGVPEIQIVTDGDTAIRKIPSPTDLPAGYLQDFLDSVFGRPVADGVTSERVIAASRWALEAQGCAASLSKNH